MYKKKNADKWVKCISLRKYKYGLKNIWAHEILQIHK